MQEKHIGYVVLDETISYEIDKEYTYPPPPPHETIILSSCDKEQSHCCSEDNVHFSIFPLFIDQLWEMEKCAVIEILGDINHDAIGFFTNKFKILRYVTLDELLECVPDGEFKAFNGDVYRCLNKKLHSIDDLPSVQLVDGHKEWHDNGELHRDNNLPAIECANGKKYWFSAGLICNESHSDDDSSTQFDEENDTLAQFGNLAIY
jgi:hypothetical protein